MIHVHTLPFQAGQADKCRAFLMTPVEAADPQRVFLENFMGGSMEGHAGEGWWALTASGGHCLQYDPSGHAPAPGEELDNRRQFRQYCLQTIEGLSWCSFFYFLRIEKCKNSFKV